MSSAKGWYDNKISQNKSDKLWIVQRHNYTKVGTEAKLIAEEEIGSIRI